MPKRWPQGNDHSWLGVASLIADLCPALALSLTAQLVTAALRAYDPAMGIAEDILGQDGWHAALAALSWQLDLGVTEVIGDAATERYGLAEPAAPPRQATAAAQTAAIAGLASAPLPAPDAKAQLQSAIDAAVTSAARAADLHQLRQAIDGFGQCDLRRGARNLVFSDGDPGARVMVVADVPQRDEDQAGRPMAGPAGALFDRMFAAIGLSRGGQGPQGSVYLAAVLPWKPPGDRPATEDEIAMMRPFLERHILLQDPGLIVVMGNTPLLALTGQGGIARARGQWFTALGRPVLAMQHPSQMLNDPVAKRNAWADLLVLRASLRAMVGAP